MTKLLALGLVVAALLALPGAVRASNVAPRSMFIPDTVYARQWAPHRVPIYPVPRRAVMPGGVVTGPVVVAPPAVVAPQPVWVQEGWAWDGWQWVWVPGHWAW
jgi:hypothetical protein